MRLLRSRQFPAAPETEREKKDQRHVRRRHTADDHCDMQAGDKHRARHQASFSVRQFSSPTHKQKRSSRREQRSWKASCKTVDAKNFVTRDLAPINQNRFIETI